MYRTQRNAAAGLGVLLALAIGVWLGLPQTRYADELPPELQWWSQPPSDSPAGAITTGDAGDCAHLAGRGREVFGDSFGAHYSVAEYVGLSESVATVVISAVREARFDTESGAPPPPLPTDAEPAEWGEAPLAVLSPVVMTATEIYSGSIATGYVVARWGGTTDACPDYEYAVEPQMLLGDAGSEGMVMLIDHLDDFLLDPPGWFEHLMLVASELNESPGNNYVPALLVNWYLYDRNAGTATSTLEAPMTIAQLEDEVEEATGP